MIITIVLILVLVMYVSVLFLVLFSVDYPSSFFDDFPSPNPSSGNQSVL